MKKITMFVLMALVAVMVPAGAGAQGLGGLLKKGKEAVEKGRKVLEETTSSETAGDEGNAVSTTTAVQINGMEVVNPIKTYMDVEPVGLYGVPRTETKGDAYLVLKVRNKERVETALFGSSIENKKMIAADDNGNVYNIDSSGAMRYDTPSDMMVKIVMDEPAMMFMDVPVGMTVMPVVKIGISLDASHKGNLTFRNVPVFWDETPE
ncbi:MAG: hypothetical protein HDR80_01580 [Bacteroides sp.]|nr:hypothetical protein [Bacteroides sp.]